MNKAIAAARHQSQHGPAFRVGMCKQDVRECYGIASDGTPDAVGEWTNCPTARRHPVKPGQEHTIPRGVPVIFGGGSEGHGHIVIATGYEGRCWSPDGPGGHPGYFQHVEIGAIPVEWPSLHLLGWVEELDGVRVYTPPAPRKPPAKKAPAKKAPAKKATAKRTPAAR